MPTIGEEKKKSEELDTISISKRDIRKIIDRNREAKIKERLEVKKRMMMRRNATMSQLPTLDNTL